MSSAAPFCFATGLTAGAFRGEVWISSALASRLDPAQRDVVLAHERAHLDRNDAGWRLAAELLSLPLYPALRRAILQDEALAAEQACDEAAGQRVGDRLRVAETLLVVERLAGAAAPSNAPGLLAFRGSSVAARVRSLLEAPPPEPSWQPGPWIGAALLGGALWLAADPIHHWTEHWLRVLL